MKIRLDENKTRIRISPKEYETLLEKQKIYGKFKLAEMLMLSCELQCTNAITHALQSLDNHVMIQLPMHAIKKLDADIIEFEISKDDAHRMIIEIDKAKHEGGC